MGTRSPAWWSPCSSAASGGEVSTDIGHRLLDGVDPGVITTTEDAATGVPGIAHARARWTGRTLPINIEGWVNPDLPVCEADQLGALVQVAVHNANPEARAVSFSPRAMPITA